MNNLHVTRYNQQFMINNLPELKSKQLHHELETWKRLLTQYIRTNISLKLMYCSGLKAISKHGEEERDFRIRLQISYSNFYEMK